jgi:hypothetical protein
MFGTASPFDADSESEGCTHANPSLLNKKNITDGLGNQFSPSFTWC